MEKEIDFIYSEAEKLQMPIGLSHNDLWHTNILYDQDKGLFSSQHSWLLNKEAAPACYTAKAQAFVLYTMHFRPIGVIITGNLFIKAPRWELYNGFYWLVRIDHEARI